VFSLTACQGEINRIVKALFFRVHLNDHLRTADKGDSSNEAFEDLGHDPECLCCPKLKVQVVTISIDNNHGKVLRIWEEDSLRDLELSLVARLAVRDAMYLVERAH